MEFVISSSDSEQEQAKGNIQKIKRKVSDSEEEVVVSQRNFRKKISSKVAGNDFFDFNVGFTKVKPNLSTVLDTQYSASSPAVVIKDTSKTKIIQKQQFQSKESDTDGSITPPPSIFKDSDELKNVFTRLDSFKSLKNTCKSTDKTIKKTIETCDTVNVSVVVKTWPESSESNIFSSLNSNESFHDLASKLKVMIGQEVVLMYKNNRIYPSSTPNSLKYLGFNSSTPLTCYSLQDFNNYQSFLSEKKQELLSELVSGQEESFHNSDMEQMNIKIQDSLGSTLKLAAKESTTVEQILIKWSEMFHKSLKSIRLKSQGEIISGILKEADVEDGDVLEIFYV